MGQLSRVLVIHTILFHFSRGGKTFPEYDNLNDNSSVDVNCSEVLKKLVTAVEYSVEDFTDYFQEEEEEEPKYSPDLPKSRKTRGINRVLSWVGRGFNKVFNSPYIYNFYPLINYSVGKVMQHLPFLGNSPSNLAAGPPSPDYPQTSSQPNPQQLQQQQKIQQEYEEDMERKQREMQQKQEEEEAKAKHAAEEKKLVNERAKKLAAKYVELYFAKQASSSPITYKVMPQNYEQGAYNLPAQPLVYNNPVYDQVYPQANYSAAYPSVDTLADPAPLPIPPVYPAPADAYANV